MASLDGNGTECHILVGEVRGQHLWSGVAGSRRLCRHVPDAWRAHRRKETYQVVALFNGQYFVMPSVVFRRRSEPFSVGRAAAFLGRSAQDVFVLGEVRLVDDPLVVDPGTPGLAERDDRPCSCCVGCRRVPTCLWGIKRSVLRG